MLVLGLETSTLVNSVAISQNHQLKGQILFNPNRPQNNNLIQSIDFLLKSLEIEGKDLDGIAVSIGPGSYTGLRISLSVAKSLAYCWDKPLTAVNSLDALAQHEKDQDRMICPIIRFRKNEYHYAFFKSEDLTLNRQSEYSTNQLKDILSECQQSTVFIGLIADEDKELFLSRNSEVFYSDHLPEAKWIALLGEQNLEKGIKEDINEISPFYMHEFPIRG